MKTRSTLLALAELLVSAALGGFALGGVFALSGREDGPWWQVGLQFGGMTTAIVAAAILGVGISLVMIRFGMLFLLVGLGMVVTALAMGVIAWRVESLDQGQRIMFAFVLGPMFGFLGIAMLFADLKARLGAG